jgi:superfamily II DNA/RNA helicase
MLRVTQPYITSQQPLIARYVYFNSLKIRCFSTTPVTQGRTSRIRKPNYSTLRKHQAPDNLTGYQRRKILLEEQKYKKTPVSEKTRGFIPVRFKLQPIPSDVTPKKTTSSKSLEDDQERILAHTSSANVKTFDMLPIEPEMKSALNALFSDMQTDQNQSVIEQLPLTSIQSLVLPSMLKRNKTSREILCAAETGSGKTLAYLIPVIHHLRREEAAATTEEEKEKLRKARRVRAMIVAPSTHLSDQITAVTSDLNISVKNFKQMVDIAIGTPRALADLFRKGSVTAGEFHWLILDEADTLLDDEQFAEECQYLLSTLRAVSETTQRPYHVMLVAATMPKAIMDKLPSLFPNLVKMTTVDLHRTHRIHQNFIDVKEFGGSRDAALAHILSRSREVTMVFCNRRETCDRVQAMLAQRGISAAVFHKGMDSTRIAEIVGGDRTQRALRKAKEETSNEKTDKDTATPSDEPLPDILICTDLASRGLDTKRVQHVILYDFPTTVVDYIHRVGRTGRAGRKGHVTAIIGRRDRQLAERIRRCIRDRSILK